MPLSLPRISVLLLAASLAGPAAGQTPTAYPPVLSRQPITVDADSSNVDYKTHTVVFEHITITQGRITVRADHARATGMGFQNSRWTFDGNVSIQAPPRGSLNSDEATVEFRDNHITRATVTGNPAQFTQRSAATGKIAQGHADQIVYDVDQGTVALSQNASLSDGRNIISGPLVIYNVIKDRIQASSPGPGQHVHITITPQAPAHQAPAGKPPAAGALSPGKESPPPKPPATHGAKPVQPHGNPS